MKLSLGWLNEFVEHGLTVAELDDTLTKLGLEVESVEYLGREFDHFVVGRVLTKAKHPKADKLSVCEVEEANSVVRTIVCGAPNVDAGQMVVVALPGAVVPNGGFEISRRVLRGVESDGMICSKAELGLGDDSDGIWVLPDDAPIGQPFATYAGLSDTVLEIGITPNRADCLSHLGIARELAAATNRPLKIPATSAVPLQEGPAAGFTVLVKDPDLCPRYAGLMIKGVRVVESPDWLKKRLTALGLRPRNAIVDITNLVLMEVGQPLHAFDADMINGKEVVVRRAGAPKKFVTLDSKERDLLHNDLMICDKEQEIAIAGVMGGENSEITPETTNVFLESAYFAPSSIRRTAKRLGISSDASYRFERGVDINGIPYALERAADLISALAGGEVVAPAIDVYRKVERPSIALRYRKVAEIGGVDLSNKEVRSILERLGFDVVSDSQDLLSVVPPSFRIDMEQEIDLVEEVVRLYGYDNIETDSSNVFPSNVQIVDSLVPSPDIESIRDFLTHRGLQEIYTYVLGDGADLAAMNVQAVELHNPLGAETSRMRSSLIGGALRVVATNKRNGTEDLAVFEIGKVFSLAQDLESLESIREEEMLVIAVSGASKPRHWSGKTRAFDFFDLKGLVSDTLEYHGVTELEQVPATDSNAFFSPNRLDLRHDGVLVGQIGEIRQRVLQEFEIGAPVMVGTIDLRALAQCTRTVGRYRSISAYPQVVRDIAMVVDETVSHFALVEAINSSGAHLVRSVELFDVYQGQNLGVGKRSLAFSITLGSSERTLTDEEVVQTMALISGQLAEKFGAQIRD